MKEVVVFVTLLVTLTLAQGQHHRNRHNRDRREWPYLSNYNRDTFSENEVPRGPNQGEPGLPGLPGLQGPPGTPGICDCPEPAGGCGSSAVHMFDFYHDMAGSNIGVGSLAFITNTNDMWLKTVEGWKKIGWLK